MKDNKLLSDYNTVYNHCPGCDDIRHLTSSLRPPEKLSK